MNALLLVDLQNDFLPGGALAVPEGDLVIPVANRLAAEFPLVIATQDWHPADHGSFAANHPGRRPGDAVALGGVVQVLWPTHCVQDTWGADFPDNLDTGWIRHVVVKGTDPMIDSYSGFFDNGHRRATDLGDFLEGNDVETLYILGLATDYCVKATALDARGLGFETYLITDGCRGVNLRPDDSDRALEEMRSHQVNLIQSTDI